MKLWKKKYALDKKIEKFTVGNDFLLDRKLVYFDCVASIAHAKMLAEIGILTKSELKKLIEALNEIIRLDKKGKFEIKQQDEDCHTAIENYLTRKCGNAGKKIHTARSRNDQVLTALRLYEKSELSSIIALIDSLVASIRSKIKSFGSIKVAGYTHMRKAMPTDIKTLFGAYIDSLSDDKKNLLNIARLIDKSPLGSAAGFGVPVLNINRKMTAELLGFKEVQQNPIYCQNSRGKFEALIADGLTQLMMSLNKIATDLLLFSMDEFGYFSLPAELCTGSSAMPQKKNPDVLELLRGKYSIVLGYSAQIRHICANLISGYNRDLQLTKEPLMRSIDAAKECLSAASLVFEKLQINRENCKKSLTKELYATEEAYKLVKKGKAFRDTYREISKNFN
jgi:argininosuccinate lyase